MTLGDWPERIPQREVPSELRLLEFGCAAAPVVCCEFAYTVGTEAVGQEPRLHRAITNDTRSVRGTPGNLMYSSLTTDHGEGWLEGIHVMDRLAPFEEPGIEVRHAHKPHFSFFDEPHHLCPRILHVRTDLIRPVELV